MPRVARTAAVEETPKRQYRRRAPVVIRKETEFVGQVGQDVPREMKSTGPARESLDPPVIQPVGKVVSKQKLEMLKFMEDVLTIIVHDSTNPMDDPIPMVWNDGRSQAFIRGQEQQVKRKYVEVLARARKTTYTQEKYLDGVGNEAYRNIPHTAPRFPFSVLADPDPRGRDWLKNISAEG